MSWFSRLRNVFRKEELDRELEEELQFHAERRAADLGLSAAETQRRLGNGLRLRQESRDIKIATWLETLIQDIRIGLRIWRRTPVMALAAILTVALGAGMNIAVFQVTWNVLLKPLPFRGSDRLVQIWVDDGKEQRTPPFNKLIERWREGSRTLSEIAAYRPWRVTIVSGGDPEQVFSGLVSPEFFSTLGAPILRGHAFTNHQLRTGTDDMIVLREGYWRRRFHADSSIVGRQIIVDGALCRVTGIVSDSFMGTPLVQGARRGADAERGTKAEPDVYLPISRARVGARLRVPTSFVIARLNGAATPDQARQELTALAGAEEKRRVWVSYLQNEIGYKLRPALFALLAATACVLLIACANLANLLMSHAMTRRRELAVRSALGAGRPRIVRQLLVEATTVLLAGIAAGLVLSRGMSRVMTALYPNVIPRGGDESQWIAYAIAVSVTLAAGVLFGALPAWRMTAESNEEALRVSRPLMSRGSRKWSEAMVAVQVGLTTVVLFSAGLLFKSFVHLRDLDIGIQRDHIVTASVDLPEARFKTREDRSRFGAEWLRRVQAIPGVTAAAISNSLPLRYTTLLEVLLHVPGESKEQAVGGRAVAGDYFEALGMSWVAGGPFDQRRTDQVVVNEAFVRRYLQGRSAVGTALGAGKQMSTITGVVRDVRHIGLQQPATPEVYMPFSVFPLNPVDTVVRSSLPPGQVASAVRRELQALDSQLALGRVMSMSDVIDDHLSRPRFQAVLLALFAMVAIALAAVGTYGVISQRTRSRVPEFGLRRALGAGTPALYRLVLVDGLKAPAAGLAVGLLSSAFIAGRSLETLIYGVVAHDPVVLLLAAGVPAVASVLACALPGRSAASVEPSRALRQD